MPRLGRPPTADRSVERAEPRRERTRGAWSACALGDAADVQPAEQVLVRAEPVHGCDERMPRVGPVRHITPHPASSSSRLSRCATPAATASCSHSGTLACLECSSRRPRAAAARVAAWRRASRRRRRWPDASAERVAESRARVAAQLRSRATDAARVVGDTAVPPPRARDDRRVVGRRIRHLRRRATRERPPRRTGHAQDSAVKSSASEFMQ